MKKIYLLLGFTLLLFSVSNAQIFSANSGNWDNPSTWAGGVIPIATDNVSIVGGNIVTLNTSATINSLNITAGTLQYGTGSNSLTTTGNVLIAAASTISGPATGNVITNQLIVNGNLTNNGLLDLSTNGNTAGVDLVFNGATSNTFDGTGTNDILSITIDKGTSVVNVLELNVSNFTFKGNAITVGNGNNAFLNLENGTFKLSGTFNGSNGVFAGSGTYVIPSTAQFWLNNANFTVVARNGNAQVDGTLRVDAGTYNIGEGDGNRLAYQSNSVITINGGTVNLASRMTSASDYGIIYTQTGGVFNVNTVASSSGGFASFDIRNADNSTFNMSGGVIAIQNANSGGSGPRDYNVNPVVQNITGGTIQIGNSLSGTAQNFAVQGVFPSLVLDNTVSGHTVTLLNDANVLQNTEIKAGTSLILDGFAFRQSGLVLTNAGTLNGTAINSSLLFVGSVTQTFNGNGTITSPLNNLIVNNGNGLSIANTVASELVTNELTMANGNITTGVTTLVLGNSPTNTGTFNYSFGTIVGKFKRWISTTTGTRDFPIGTSVSIRNANINFTTAPTVGGSLTAEWVNSPSGTNGLPLLEGAIIVNTASSEGYWAIVANDGLTGGVYTGTFTATSMVTVTDYTKLVLLKRANSASPWTLNGIHVTTTGNNGIPVLRRTNMSGFSDFSVGSDGTINPLPIKIEYFTVKSVGNINQLDWKVNCTNTTGVTINLERSSDKVNFQTINVEQASTLRCLQPFKYNDAQASSTIAYYRLKTTEADGRITYSHIVAVINNGKKLEIIGLMPNIVQTNTVLNISAAVATKSEIAISDMSGKIVQKQSVLLTAGSNQVPINVSNLSAGTYNLILHTNEGVSKTIRFVKQ